MPPAENPRQAGCIAGADFWRVALAGAVVLVGLVLLSAGTGAAQEPGGLGGVGSVSVVSSCLAQNGRIDVNLVNGGADAAVYRVEVTGLTPRQISVAGLDWGRVSVTGRPEGVYRVVVQRDGVGIYDGDLTVGCDLNEPIVTGPEVEVLSACRDGNGYILLQFVNAGAQPAGYVIAFESVANRSTTAAAFGAAIRAVTGRFDGEFLMNVRRNGVVIHTEAVTVACDSPDPTPTPTPPAGAVDVAFQIKETAGVSATAYPVHVVIPVAEGELASVDGLRVVDGAGDAVPAQFDVLNRWWSSGGSVRHLVARFNADVAAFTAPGTGIADYRLMTGANPAPTDPIVVADGPTIRVSNSELTIDVVREPFAIKLPTGDLDARLLDRNGARRPTFDRDDITVEIEESGPIRAVIRASAPTRTEPDGSILHGWSLRLYAYADNDHVKFDVQLQNAALDSVLSGPLYFESFDLSVATGSAGVAEERRAVLDTTPLADPPPGSVGNQNAGLVVRQFYETWPNGVAISPDGTLTAQLFPEWSENQILVSGNSFADEPLVPNGTGLYWLEDMQAVIKEFVIDFGQSAAADRAALAALIDHPPVAVVPVEVYRSSQATLDLGGVVPPGTAHGAAETTRTPAYLLQAQPQWMSELGAGVLMGWDEFLAQPNRKRQPAQTGGWPDPLSNFVATGDPTDYFLAADRARGELNVMPQWLPGYDYADDQATLQLTENPYNGSSWRQFVGHDVSHTRFEYLPGTSQDAKPRDDAHGWFYNVESSYYLTADPWVRDWYDFVAEFRKVRLNQGDPFPDMSGRAVGHAISHAMQAHRITGDSELLALASDYIDDEVRGRLNSIGAYESADDRTAAWQTGYLARGMINYLEELPGADIAARDTDVFDVLQQMIEWNVAVGAFGDWRPVGETFLGQSSGSGLTIADPQAWYFDVTGWEPARTSLLDFLAGGVNGGDPPYGNTSEWVGGFEGRWVESMLAGGVR